MKIAANSLDFGPSSRTWSCSELRVRYQRSILGFFWSLLNPLLMMVTLSWVFSYLDDRL